jgi:membrane carboxypeptidase/penicillin-binding protein
MDPATGEVRALVGGRDFNDSKFNRATQALRQPGSTFKPFVYYAAINSGMPASQILYDAPLMIELPDGSSTRRATTTRTSAVRSRCATR